MCDQGRAHAQPADGSTPHPFSTRAHGRMECCMQARLGLDLLTNMVVLMLQIFSVRCLIAVVSWVCLCGTTWTLCDELEYTTTKPHDSCCYGLRGDRGVPVERPWKLRSNSSMFGPLSQMCKEDDPLHPHEILSLETRQFWEVHPPYRQKCQTLQQVPSFGGF